MYASYLHVWRDQIPHIPWQGVSQRLKDCLTLSLFILPAKIADRVSPDRISPDRELLYDFMAPLRHPALSDGKMWAKTQAVLLGKLREAHSELAPNRRQIIVDIR